MDARRRDELLAAARAIGLEHGRNAAAWWEQDAIGGRSSGDPRPTARAILRGLEDGDPMVYDSLPAPDLSMQWADGYSTRQLLEDAGATEAEAEASIASDLITLEDAAATVYEDAYLEASEDAVTAYCRAVLEDAS